MWKLLRVFNRSYDHPTQLQYIKANPYCLCWLMAELSPSCCWLSAWCKADMILPRRSGWMFSLLSSHSTSPPSAIVEINTKSLQKENKWKTYFWYLLSGFYNSYSNLTKEGFLVPAFPVCRFMDFQCFIQSINYILFGGKRTHKDVTSGFLSIIYK